MAELLPDIRNTTRAVIIRDQQILLLKKLSSDRGEHYALPGGGQEPGETLAASLQRECVEEIDTTVSIGDLLHVADFFKLRDSQPPTRRHLVEFLFRCSVPDDYSPRCGPHPDKHQVDVVWTGLAGITRLPLFPNYLSDCIVGKTDLYLGTFHDQGLTEDDS